MNKIFGYTVALLGLTAAAYLISKHTINSVTIALIITGISVFTYKLVK